MSDGRLFAVSVLAGNGDPEHCSADREDGGSASEGGDGGHRRDGYRRVRRCALPVHWWRRGEGQCVLPSFNHNHSLKWTNEPKHAASCWLLIKIIAFKWSSQYISFILNEVCPMISRVNNYSSCKDTDTNCECFKNQSKLERNCLKVLFMSWLN